MTAVSDRRVLVTGAGGFVGRALTAGFALLPLVAAAGAPGNEIQSPMAIVILGGLVTSTLLNLIVIPSVYYMLEKRKS